MTTGSKTIAQRTGVLALFALILLMAAPHPARAHSGEQSYVYLDIYDSTVEGRVEFPIGDLNEILGLGIPLDEAGALTAAEQNRSRLTDYAAEHLSIHDQTGAWPLAYGEFSVLEIGAAGAYLIVEFEVDRTFDPVPRQFTVTYSGITHAKPERDALLIIGTDWGSGTFNNEASELLRFTPEATTQAVDLGNTSFWKGVAGVIGLGTEHIRIGTDHILFIFALVLPSVLVFSRRDGWLPAASFRSSLWRVLKIVTMFTVAHTITLTLGGLGIIELPPVFVETVIAVSIAMAALHNIWPVFVNREWMLAFGFGLFHGFGFAGLLSDLGLTQSRRFVSLLGFNLGIEIGQAIIILLVFPSLFLLRRTHVYLGAMRLGSIVLAAVATAWALDRTFGIDLQVDRAVNAVVLWPRSLAFVALMAVVAVVVFRIAYQRGQLLPVVETAAGGEAASVVPG